MIKLIVTHTRPHQQILFFTLPSADDGQAYENYINNTFGSKITKEIAVTDFVKTTITYADCQETFDTYINDPRVQAYKKSRADYNEVNGITTTETIENT
jgi:hypothetical protein